MIERYKFIILSDANINENQKAYLKEITEDAELAFRTTRKNLHADLVDEMVDYGYKGIIINGRVSAKYIAEMNFYAKEKITSYGKGVEEKIYIIQDNKLVSFWDVAFGDAKEYSTELI